jgi:hypothetical protein
LLKGIQDFMLGSTADGNDEWKLESFAAAVKPREVLAAFLVNPSRCRSFRITTRG